MAARIVFLLTLFLFLVFPHAGVAADDEVQVPVSGGQDSVILEKLHSKIHSLELQIEETTREIEEKDNVIAAKEVVIKQKSESIASLESQIADIHKTRKLDAAEQVKKAQERSEELEKLVEKLGKDMDDKSKEKDLLEARQTDALKKTSELNRKLESLQKIIDEQNIKLQKTERALRIAEEEMIRAKYEAASKAKELLKAHGAWIPPWLALHVENYRLILENNWKVHVKPGLDQLVRKALEKKAQAEEWAAPHVETVKIKLIPAIKEQWIVIGSAVEPHVQTLTAKTVEAYETSKDAIAPHILKIKELADPYFQEFRKISRPYIDHVATAAKPHVEKVYTVIRPYTQEAKLVYGRFLEHASKYHLQVQEKVQEKLKSHDITKSVATKELVWLSASVLLSLPVILLLKIFSAVFSKKATKTVRSSHHARSRKGKRGHSDK